MASHNHIPLQLAYKKSKKHTVSLSVQVSVILLCHTPLKDPGSMESTSMSVEKLGTEIIMMNIAV